MEENGKQPQDKKKKEEETGNLLEKEFRAMLVKMIYFENLENNYLSTLVYALTQNVDRKDTRSTAFQQP